MSHLKTKREELRWNTIFD